MTVLSTQERAQAIVRWRDELKAKRLAIREAFFAKPDTRTLWREHTRLVARVLIEAWKGFGAPKSAALVAVGGFGRGQLCPHSDVDLLLLLAAPPTAEEKAFLEAFVGLVWDVGIEAGHSVRTIEECEAEMAGDVTVRTNLLERKFLVGSRALFREFESRYDAAMNPAHFLDAKLLEQQQRHLRYHDTAYNLEPNVKESPGGLRDLHTILWVARAARLGNNWAELAKSGLMTPQEARSVSVQGAFLGALRIRLHYLAGRREDRLVFDQQNALALQLGLADTPTKRAGERLMQRYYRAAKIVRQANVILLQNLHARLQPLESQPRLLNNDFCAIDWLLHVTDATLFERRPAAMLDAFLMMQRHPELKGMSARTLRALWRNRHRLDARFRRDPANRARFVQIFREARGQTHELRRMNLYGILGSYLPAFGRIVGQMQHDLFHVYTVDEHILMVVRNLRRFAEPQHAHEYPLCSRLFTDFERKEVLYLAALFHDIAKGRGGDHSKLGEREAERFCRTHGLPKEDGELIAWLVAQHLSMSATAQKQDLTDPEVINAFAGKVGNERRLIALYILTVADIRGTSPKVWNAWKARLLEDLFQATRARLAGSSAAVSVADSLQERQREALRLLRLFAVPENAEGSLWAQLDSVYFQRHTADEIAWHARHLYYRVRGDTPVVRARLARGETGLQVMVYLPDQKELFARICGFFGRQGLSIVDARIHTTRHGYALDTFIVHDPSEPDASYREAVQLVEFELQRTLAERRPLEPPSAGRVSRHLKHFPLSPEVRISPDDKGTHFILEVVAGDRPGLLARLAYTLAMAGINMVSAKINTLGERAEDVFLIDGVALHDEHETLKLETAIYDQLRIG